MSSILDEQHSLQLAYTILFTSLHMGSYVSDQRLQWLTHDSGEFGVSLGELGHSGWV